MYLILNGLGHCTNYRLIEMEDEEDFEELESLIN